MKPYQCFKDADFLIKSVSLELASAPNFVILCATTDYGFEHVFIEEIWEQNISDVRFVI